MDIYSKYIYDTFQADASFKEALDIATSSVRKGQIILVGGQIFRTLISKIYSIPLEKKFDFDFLVETPLSITSLIAPKGWTLSETSFHEPRYIRGEDQIDIFGFDNSVNPYIKLDLSTMTPEDKINSYFSKVPLNIQMIGYDIREHKIINRGGLEAIQKKTIKINCMEEAEKYSSRHNLTIVEFLDKKVDYGIFTKTYPN